MVAKPLVNQTKCQKMIEKVTALDSFAMPMGQQHIMLISKKKETLLMTLTMQNAIRN